MRFGVDKAMQTIAAREGGTDSGFVLCDPSGEVGRDTCIEDTIAAVGQDTDGTGTHAHGYRTERLTDGVYDIPRDALVKVAGGRVKPGHDG